jgi:8-oxo-dGTP pyrophosphatase MutT (NUDIX family)
MSYSEKIDILSMKYSQLWYRVMLYYPDYLNINSDRMSTGDINAYIKKKNKYESTFANDGCHKLKQLISGTNNSELLWEIPKGRKCKNELTMDCAVREFKEETNIRSSQYKVMTNINPVTESYINTGTTYINKYYIAETTVQSNPHVCFSADQQITEIEDIRWMNTAEIRQCDQTGRLQKQVAHILKLFKIHRKRHTKD